MDIQEITISNNQKKKLQKNVQDNTVLFQDDNGDLVVDVAAYQAFKQEMRHAPIESVIGDDVLNFEARYFVFS